MKKPFRVGDRVMVRDIGHSHKGKIHSLGTVYITVISDCDGACRPYHPGQLRRLVKKPRPPEPAELVRVERWTLKEWTHHDFVRLLKCPDERLQPKLGGKSGRILHLVELRPGEIPVSRRRLAEAWDKVDAGFIHTQSPRFAELCEILGLPPDNAVDKK